MIKKILIIIIFSIALVSKTNAAFNDQCYPNIGCFPIPVPQFLHDLERWQQVINELTAKIAGDLSLLKNGTFSGELVATDAHYGNRTLIAFFTRNVLTRVVCANGGYVNFVYSSICTNGAIDPGSCRVCSSGASMQNTQCVCNNGATTESSCSSCAQGYTFDNNQCVPSCSLTNVCNQTSQGVLRNGVCTTPSGGNINNSCITTFNSSSGSVNPNGSVEFKWSITPLPPNVGSRCGFVDLTTPTPRPIPGLQNLDPNQDRARISNIQATTRFCLICQFYNLLNNSILGNAAAHQWVRVIRVGEN